MKKVEIERIKDILIDFVFDYIYLEKIKRFESGADSLEVDVDVKVKEDPSLKSFRDYIFNKPNAKYFITTRETEYCNMYEEGSISSSLINRLQRLGFNKKNVPPKIIGTLIQELCDRGYFVRNYPDKNEVKLTEKGINHFISGSSFEQKYNDNYEVRRANRISTTAICIAGASALISILSVFS